MFLTYPASPALNALTSVTAELSTAAQAATLDSILKSRGFNWSITQRRTAINDAGLWLSPEWRWGGDGALKARDAG